ncbi:hypothetical protein V5O48_006263 [Marasmius crinis-equi]|uniref:Uncharacterized protein n=1 Tax=Marasmius crinis-equi TaxID=585013 RepID=A0ABR3FJY6_9AGAR
MSISLPIEDLSRLRVWAHLSQSGQPVLSMTLKADASPRPSTSASSGIYVNFERCIENGCWSLAMDATVMQQDFGTTGDSRMSLDASESSFLDPSSQSGVPDIPHVAESCIPDVPGIETDPSNFEMSSLLAWLSSQEEAKAVQNPDEYMSLGLLPGIPHSALELVTLHGKVPSDHWEMVGALPSIGAANNELISVLPFHELDVGVVRRNLNRRSAPTNRTPVLETRTDATYTSSVSIESSGDKARRKKPLDGGIDDHLHPASPNFTRRQSTRPASIAQPLSCGDSIFESQEESDDLIRFFNDTNSDGSESEGDGIAHIADDLECFFSSEEGDFVQVLELPDACDDVPITAARMEYMFDLDSNSCSSPIRCGFDREGVERPLCSTWFGSMWTPSRLSSAPSTYVPFSPHFDPGNVASFFDVEEDFAALETFEALGEALRH